MPMMSEIPEAIKKL